jgi:hypothetical protein
MSFGVIFLISDNRRSPNPARNRTDPQHQTGYNTRSKQIASQTNKCHQKDMTSQNQMRIAHAKGTI